MEKRVTFRPLLKKFEKFDFMIFKIFYEHKLIFDSSFTLWIFKSFSKNITEIWLTDFEIMI